MTYNKIYIGYSEKLLYLPMNDNTFIAKLNTQNLLPGDTESKIEGKSTPIDKASYFLNNIIKPSIDLDNGDCFNKLLSVMEQCGYDYIKQLASEIRSAIEGGEEVTCSKPDSSASTSKKVSTAWSRKFSNVKCPKCGKNATPAKVQNRRKNTYEHPYYYCAEHEFVEWKNTAGVYCDCNLKAKKDITKKRGPNHGKWFYNCKNGQCDYFVWSMDVESTYGRKIPYIQGYKYPIKRRRNYKY